MRTSSTFYVLSIISLLFILSCGFEKNEENKVEYENGRQLLTLNNLTKKGKPLRPIEVGCLKPEYVNVGEQIFVRIYLEDPTMFKLINAFVFCDEVDNPSVDTNSFSLKSNSVISGCSQKLEIENDTIKIYFEPSTVGEREFYEIKILTKGYDEVFRTIDYSFKYVVK